MPYRLLVVALVVAAARLGGQGMPGVVHGASLLRLVLVDGSVVELIADGPGAPARVGRVAGGAGGFAAGDTITSFAGIVAPPLEAVRVRWDRLPAGDTVTIGVTRDGTRRSLAVVKPTAAQLAAAGVMVVPPGAPAAAVGGTWRTAPAPGSAGEGGPVLEIVGNEIRSDDDGTLKVMMKRRDPRGAAVALHPLDQILGLNGVPPRDLADLIARYDAIAVGDRVSLRVRRRDGREEDIAFAKPAP